jgi:hypothetical protein
MGKSLGIVPFVPCPTITGTSILNAAGKTQDGVREGADSWERPPLDLWLPACTFQCRMVSIVREASSHSKHCHRTCSHDRLAQFG